MYDDLILPHHVFGKAARQSYGGFVGEDGRPVKRTKYTHPYNYDPFVLWICKEGIDRHSPNGDSVYTDRLLLWDWDKHNELCRKHFGNEGQYWNNRKPEKIEAFLRDFFDKPDLKLVQIVEYCNQSSGYPTWRLDYIA